MIGPGFGAAESWSLVYCFTLNKEKVAAIFQEAAAE